MAHRPTLQRKSAASESNPSDPTQPSKPSFMLKHLSTLNSTHKHSQSKTKHPFPVDTHLQAKVMSASAIFDSSKYSLPKPTTIEKQRSSTMPERRTSKEKPRSKLLQGLLKNEKKKSMVEDVKIEKLRNIPVVEKEHDDDDVIKRTSASLAPSGGRRRSFCGSQVDLGDFFAINGAKMISVDMPPFLQIHAVDCARKAFDSMEKFTSKTLAFSLKKEFDGVYGPAWHCIVGTSFGSFVTHSVGGFLYFSMDRKLYILLFKTAVQKAD